MWRYDAGSSAVWHNTPARLLGCHRPLKRLADAAYGKLYIYPNSHAGYYPGARFLAIKIIFRISDGRLLGAQAVGQDSMDKRIDTLAMAIQMGATVYDLEEAELTYGRSLAAQSPRSTLPAW